MQYLDPEPDPVIRTVRAYVPHVDEFQRCWLEDRVMEQYLDRFVAHLDRPGSVLDVGCGPGRDVRWLTDRGVEAVGVDLCHPMLAAAAEVVPGAVFRLMDVRSLAYPPETFAGVWACAILHHLPAEQLPVALAELARVLRPGGVLAAAVEEGDLVYDDSWGRYRRQATAAGFTQALKVAGFTPCAETLPGESDKGPLPPSGPKRWLNVLARKTGPAAQGEAGCPFCPDDRFAWNRTVGLPAAGSILWGDEDLFVVPDLAPLVDGHLLVVTTRHHRCVGAAGGLIAAVRAAQQRVARLFATVYDSPTLFVEHGPARCGAAGACVDHAHVHCLPLRLAVAPAVERLLRTPGRPAALEDLAGLSAAGRSYLYVEDEGGGIAFPVDVLPSQFFRQLVAAELRQAEWRWQSACRRPESAAAFRRTLGRLASATDGLS
jgi:SAM-dependent methyltransferase